MPVNLSLRFYLFQVLELLLDNHGELNLLVEHFPEKKLLPVFAVQWALGRTDILPWVIINSPSVVGACNALEIFTRFVGN